jgi:hypothetical protein
MYDVNSEVEQSQTEWFIDIDWVERNGRSLSALAWGCLCPECLKRYKSETGLVTTDKLLKSIKDCCSKSSGYVNPTMPILESVFRLMLANGNKPLTLDDIMRQLGERWGISIYRVSTETLRALLNRDQYYGLNPVEG